MKATLLIMLCLLGYMAWVMNTPEREPECQPAQLSEILK